MDLNTILENNNTTSQISNKKLTEIINPEVNSTNWKNYPKKISFAKKSSEKIIQSPTSEIFKIANKKEISEKLNSNIINHNNTNLNAFKKNSIVNTPIVKSQNLFDIKSQLRNMKISPENNNISFLNNKILKTPDNYIPNKYEDLFAKNYNKKTTPNIKINNINNQFIINQTLDNKNLGMISPLFEFTQPTPNSVFKNENNSDVFVWQSKVANLLKSNLSKEKILDEIMKGGISKTQEPDYGGYNGSSFTKIEETSLLQKRNDSHLTSKLFNKALNQKMTVYLRMKRFTFMK